METERAHMSVREASNARRRMAIIDAAHAIISQKGVQALNIRDIGKTCGCAPGTIYTHFDDLDTLILHANSRTLSQLAQALETVEGRGQGCSVEERLCAMGDAYLDFALANRMAWQALFEHQMERPIPQWHRDDHFRLLDSISSLLLLHKPALDEGEVQLVTRGLYASVHGIVSLGIAPRLIRLSDDDIRQQMHLVIRGLLSQLA